VDGVDLATKEGEFLVLLGPSGCGKTTLLRMLAGLELPTSGEILIGGQVVNDLPPRARKIAMVFQSYALYPHLTVAKNIAFPLKAQGVPRAEIPGKVQWAASLFGIERLLDRKPRQLSGGERQRVALARAVIREPAVFLLDEPLSNLDAKLRASARDELQQFQRRIGTTTIYVTHDQVEAMGLGDRIAVMQGGKVRQIGSPAEVYDEPADTFVAGFLGSPPMNFVDGPGALVGFRPEHFLPREAHGDGAELLTLPLAIHRVEYLGADRLVYGTPTERFQGAKVIARLPSTVTTPVAVGDTAEFAVRVRDLKFFDRQSGRRTAAQAV
jgi:multiple sugar transport system ATP-binding protein